jgi:hypothetical protein
VTWTQLLANNEVQRHKTSKKELDKLRAVIRRDLADASLGGARPTDVSRPPTMEHFKLQKWQLHVLAIVSSAPDTTEFLSTWLSSRLGKLRARTVIISTDASESGRD